MMKKISILLILLATGAMASGQERQHDPVVAQQSPKPEENKPDHSLNIQMIFVKGGTLMMGCTSEQGDDCEDDENPARQATVSDFYIGKYEVTQAQWKAVMGTDVRKQRDKADTSEPLAGEGGNYPMYYVNWDDVEEFIRKLNAQTGKNYRLPTQTEWEYAARGGAQSRRTKYSGSNTVGDVAWYGENSGDTVHPVGQKLPNGLGLYDMSGNIWELCSDECIYDSSDTCRVLRGGNWRGPVSSCRVYDSFIDFSPDTRSDNLGFRLASGSN
jgi:formylglycine-generating enzyme required for sulfatase activity